MPVSTFRRSTKAETKKTGGKGFRGNWRERFRLPQTQPAPFVLMNHEFIDPDPDPDLIEFDPQGNPQPVKLTYYKWLKHRMKAAGGGGKERFSDEVCSRGWDKHNPQKCAGCFAMDSGNKSITLAETFSIGLVHLAVYHQHPLFDPKKNDWVKKKDNSALYVDTECTGKTCNFCRVLSGQYPQVGPKDFWPNYNVADIRNVYGSRRYMELGKGHLGDLGEWDKQIGMRCGGIAYVRGPDGQYVRDAYGNVIPKGRCNNFLSVDSYNCSRCDTVLIDAAADPRPVEVLEEVAMKKFPCHVCQQHVFLKEVNSCDVCGQASVSGIYDGVCWGARQGEGTNSHLVLMQYDSLVDFEANLHPSYRELLGGKSLKERIEELSAPYNFDELYKPKSLADQAKRLEVNLPPGYDGNAAYQNQQFQQPAGPYAGQQPPQQTPYGTPYSAPAGWTPPPQQGGYQPYGGQQQPGPAPFQPPAKPNFGQ